MAGSPIKNLRNNLVREAILRGHAEGTAPVEFLVPFADKLKEMALAGDLGAMRELFDRIDGKAAQGVTISGDENNPLAITKVVREVVKPST